MCMSSVIEVRCAGGFKVGAARMAAPHLSRLNCAAGMIAGLSFAVALILTGHAGFFFSPMLRGVRGRTH